LDQLDIFDPLLVYSEMAETSRAAVSVLEDNGFERIYRLEGGFEAWKEAGYLTVSG
jgi:rhodanese-related sulfurtransferase